MSKSVLMSLIAVVLACVVGLAACGPKPVTEPEPTTDAPTEPAAEPAADAPAEPAAEPAAAAPAEPAAAEGSAKADEGSAPAADAAAGVALNAETIVGTKWKYDAFEIKFEPDGVLKLNDAIPGTWALEGNKLKVGAMGQEFEVEVKGSNLIVEGEELSQIK